MIKLTIKDKKRAIGTFILLLDIIRLSRNLTERMEGQHIVTKDLDDGDIIYFYKNEVHNENGPAFIFAFRNNTFAYGLEGYEFEKEDWERIIRREKFKALGI